MSVVDMLSQYTETPVERRARYISPAERILTDPVAQKTFADFMWIYVGHPDVDVRRRGHERPHIPVYGPDGTTWNSDQEMFTGYSKLGDLVHVRVDPAQNHLPEGYFISIGDVNTGDLFEPTILSVDHTYDHQTGPQTTLYLDTADEEGLPAEYAPRIHLLQHTQQFTYHPGPDRASAPLLPIESLYDQVSGLGTRLGQRALTLVNTL